MESAAPALAPANVSLALAAHAREAPERSAVIDPDGARLSYAGLERRVEALAHGLFLAGLVPGDRAALFVRPGAELVALVHACFRAGVVPVLIDPGMGRRALLACVARVAPRGLVGVARAQVARRLFPRAFASVEVTVTVGRGALFGGPTLAELERAGAARGAFEAVPARPASEAAILFTSGSTGPPKGVVYEHGNFAAQVASLAGLYALEPGQVDCACFPLFALFDHALGLTSLFPPLDPARPAGLDPARVVAALEAGQATFAFGSPAIWRRIVPWARARGRRFAHLRRVAIAGAPVPPRLVLALQELLPAGGAVHTPYGATEALPVADVAGHELAHLCARIEGGEGTCVGRPVAGVEVALARLADGPLAALDAAARAEPGEPGEVCVRGAVVTRAYAGDELATRQAKVPSEAGLWHRMGDVGRLDADGRLWLLGRTAERIETADGVLFPVPLENVYDALPGVRRSALVGLGPRGRERPVLFVEPEERTDRRALEAALHAHRRDLPETARVAEIRFHPGFPVDARHNAKIRRDELKRRARA